MLIDKVPNYGMQTGVIIQNVEIQYDNSDMQKLNIDSGFMCILPFLLL